MSADPRSIRAARVFYVHALDVSSLVSGAAGELGLLQDLRARHALHQQLHARWSEHAEFCDSRQDIEERSDRAIAQGGKRVWTSVFLDDHTPTNLPCGDHLWTDGVRIPRQTSLRAIRQDLAPWVFEDSRSQLSRDGVIINTAGFELSGTVPIESVIQQLSHLRRAAYENFKHETRALLARQTPFARAFEDLEVNLRGEINREDVRAHQVLFVREVTDADAVRVEPRKLGHSKELAGLLNRATWYERYNTRYLNELAKKEIGYRNDEIYLTDRDATLIVLDGFWRDGDPLRHYMGDLLLAIEFHLGKQAFLHGQLEYSKALYSVSGDGSDGGSVSSVLRSRAILSSVYESLNFSVLISHGFTRRFVNGVSSESELATALEDVERRITNLSIAVELRAAVEASRQELGLQSASNGLQKASINLQRASNRLALMALIVAALAIVLSVLTMTT
ncbi:hypothetical protein [Kribbella sp. NPDC023855]|uniref:hypothetical protein n=1 Tax=Kribbella sp. NPDC023855 TaxID=3154698 RepID=UPI0033D0548D